jgi:integrase
MPRLKGLFKRGRKWWLRYTPSPRAKQERVPLGTENEDIATMMALERIQSAPLVGADEFQIELDRYIAESRARGTLSKSFAPTRKIVLEAFARDMKVKALDDISVGVLERWMGWVKINGNKGKGVKKETVRAYLLHVSAFCRWLVKNKKLRENPVKSIELGKRVKTWRKDFVVKDVVAKLIAEAPNDDLRFILFCGMHAGLRKMEIVEARPEWFVFGKGGRRGCINIGETDTFIPKDRDERTIPLTAEFEAFLRRYIGALPPGAKFVLRPEKEHGKHRYRVEFRKPFLAYMHAQKCTTHDMRRCFVSNKIIENGNLVPKLAKWTGDEVRTMMDHYAHLLADDDDIEQGT